MIFGNPKREQQEIKGKSDYGKDRLTGSTAAAETASFASGSPQIKTDKQKLRKRGRLGSEYRLVS